MTLVKVLGVHFLSGHGVLQFYCNYVDDITLTLKVIFHLVSASVPCHIYWWFVLVICY